MPMDLVHNTKTVKDQVPGSAVTSFSAGAAIDTAGYESMIFGMIVGTMAFTGTDKLTWTVEESLDGSSNWAGIAATDYLAAYANGVSGWDRIMDAAGDASSAFAIGVRMNTVRYKRLVPTEGGTVSVVLATWATLGHPRHAPV
jgi:hypothetical protein